jgi:glycosyltransferase involved in cell wall biosynthesis
MAATRLRLHQYRPFLAAANLELRSWTFLADADLPRWFEGSHLDRLALVARGLARVPRLLREARAAGVVVVQREVLPFGPPVLEWLLSRRRPLVWDVDDAVWQPYPSLFLARLPSFLRKTGGKYQRLCRRAAQVWAGSEVLAEWCRRWSAQVAVVPTVVDVPPEPRAAPGGRTVGWIGSPSTFPFLAPVLPAVAAVDPPVRVVVVGGGRAARAGGGVESLAWSPETEELVLDQLRVGLYPVDERHPLAEGKCAFKAILYMSRGIPAVVTPTTTNARVVRHEQEGLHARSLAEWREAVARLLDDSELWARLSRAAHARAAAEYSVATWGPRVARRLQALAGAPSAEGEPAAHPAGRAGRGAASRR